MLLPVFFIVLVVPSTYSKQFEDDFSSNESSQVEVRAVFISCQIDEKYQYGSETSRFQREEFFKHNTLRDCKNKLALTIKITSDCSHSSGDEYIPIEHVFDGFNKRRVRLLNPYILRLRRDPPFETYELHKLDIFSGVLTTSNENKHKTREVTNNRLIRNINLVDEEKWLVNGKTNGLGRCEKPNPIFISNVRNKRFDFETKLRNNPFEDSSETSTYGINYETFNYNKKKLSNINGNGKNYSESLQSDNVKNNLEGTEKFFLLYELGDPNIMFKAQVQLLEKMSTPEGRTVWKDLTKQEPARLSSLSPEWTSQDVYIRYRSSERIPKEDFTLPSTGICLLLPQNGNLNDGFSKDKLGDFIIVPIEDIETIEENGAYKRSHRNTITNNASAPESERHRRILVRLSRALFGRNEDNFVIINEGSSKYLRLPYSQPHHAQIELEAKADENQLVYVGPKIRECAPELLTFNEDETEATAKPILIPPMHTHKFCLEIPLEMPGDIAHCSVALLNDNDESVVVRDVRIKRGDRCFCVWHCQCVCLNEDPQLLCQEMSQFEQTAAGLATRDRPRHVRAACYPDVVSINMIVVAFGVLFLLLLMGLLKACLGLFLRCVGSWGIDQLLQAPRRLDCYYEPSLRCHPVVYDEEGWPVHPDTMKRTVRLISKPMEFMLNTIFFVTMPCVMLWNSVKRIMSRCKNKQNKSSCETKVKKCCSPQDLQGTGGIEPRSRLRGRRRRRHLSKWMTPQAEQLSTDIWRNGLAPQGFSSPDCMRPLLREDRFRGNKLYKLDSPAVDSEQDDTEYVLMQMQNSRETLANDLQRLKPSITD